MSSASVQRVHAMLSSALNAAVRRGLIEVSPTAWVELPNAVPSERTTWSFPEAQRFLTGIEGDELEPVFRLLLLGGLRRGEALGLRWRTQDHGPSGVRLRRRRADHARLRPGPESGRHLPPTRNSDRPLRAARRQDGPTGQQRRSRPGRHGADTHGTGNPVVLVACSTDLDNGVQAMKKLHTRWSEGAVLAAIAVDGDDRYVIDDQGHPQRVAGPEADQISAEAVLAGVPLPLRSREALADTITRPTIEVAEETNEAIAAIGMVGGSLDSVGMVS